MGILRGYFCQRCPLAFEIGGYAFWSLDGQLEQAVLVEGDGRRREQIALEDGAVESAVVIENGGEE